MKIETGRVVSITYVLSNGQGDVIDASANGAPLIYLHGGEGILPSLETALAGKITGDRFDITIEPDDAYGSYQPERVRKVPRAAFPADLDIRQGMQFDNNDTGSPLPETVIEVSSDLVTMDSNHPLAGMILHFAGSVVDVREATAEELAGD